MQVLVVGGAKSLVRGNFGARLKSQGINIGWHSSDKDGEPYTGIPKGCEGVIGVKDMVSHSQSYLVTADAKTRQIPMAWVERKWSQAAPILKMQGFPIQLESTDTPPPPASKETVFATALGYIQERREDGHTPGYPEVLGYVQGVLGSSTLFPRHVFDRVYSEAIAAYTGVVSPKRSPVPIKTSSEDVREALALLLEEDFGRILDPVGFEQLFQERFPEISVSPLTIGAFFEECRLRWKDEKSRLEDGLKWMITRYRSYLTTKEWFTCRMSEKQSKIIFGRILPWELSGKARAQVFGAWTENLIVAKFAEEYLETIRPGLVVDLTEELNAGRLQGMRIPVVGMRWYTAEVCVKEWADKYHPLKVGSNSTVGDTATPPYRPQDLVGLVQAGGPTREEVQKALSPVVPVEALANPAQDLYAIADLLEAGFNKKLEDHRAALGMLFAQQTLVLKTQMDALDAKLSLLLSAQKYQPQSPSAEDIKALSLGQALLGATGAEVRMVIGKINTP